MQAKHPGLAAVASVMILTGLAAAAAAAAGPPQGPAGRRAAGPPLRPAPRPAAQTIPDRIDHEGKQRLLGAGAADRCVPPAPFYPPFDPDPAYDVTHYDLHLDIDPKTRFLHGIVTIIGTSRRSALSQVDLDYCGPPVSSVSESVQPVAIRLSGGVLSVPLVPPRPVGQTFSIVVDYQGTLPGDRGIYFPRDGEPDTTATFSFSEPEDARVWYPCHDVPDDKATVDLFITVPDDRVAGSNGVLVEERTAGPGKRLFHWRETHPIATYLVSVAIAKYRVIHDDRLPGIPIVNYVYPADSAAAVSLFDVVPEMIQYFSSLFGPYDFDKYGHAEAPFPGGMEHQSLTTIGDFMIRNGDTYEWVVAHELAHQWWGDPVTMKDWRHEWLNEGFASYGDALWFEHAGGVAARNERMKIFSDIFKLGLSRGIANPVVNPPANQIFGFTTYDKGAWVLHMLRRIVGDSSFFRILREYHAAHRYGNATTEDFIAACESVYGSDLNWFFHPWLYGTGLPEYGLSWSSLPAAGGKTAVRVTVRQKQTAPFYPMPVDFAIASLTDTVRTTLFLDRNPQTFVVMTSAAPTDTGVVLDPDNWILRTVDIEEAPPIPAGLTLSRNTPNPFRASTTIGYALPLDAVVRLAVYDVSGRLVAVLRDGMEPAGSHEATWDGKDIAGRRAPSGIYFVKLDAAGSGSRTQRLLRIP